MLIAITRPVSSSLDRCELTHLERTPIHVMRAMEQHAAYGSCLQQLGCRVHRLPGMPDHADAVFVEDTCVVFNELAIITRPGAASRRAETATVADAMKTHRPLRFIEEPGTLDGGDVLQIGRQVFVGHSTRSNTEGIAQLRHALSPLGYSVTAVALGGALHLKSAATVIAERALLVNPLWVDSMVFGAVDIIEIDPSEPAAANALRIGDTVIYPTAFPKTQMRLKERGINLLLVDMSELAKAEGGVTCCSLIVG
jgi:dimethylargininase